MKIIKFSALILVLVMLFTVLAGCGGEIDFIGEWTANINGTDIINEVFEENTDMGAYFKVSKADIGLNLIFRKDGTYKIEIDRASVEKAVKEKDFQAELKSCYKKKLESLFKETDYNISLDKFLADSGRSFNDMYEKDVSQERIVELVSTLKTEGRYKVEEQKLFLTETKNAKLSKDIYFNVEEVNEKEIKLKDLLKKGSGKENILYKTSLPIVLKAKVK